MPSRFATRGSEEAWDAFLADYAPLVLQVVHLFERDRDEIEECFLFVCERLRRDGLRRLHRFRTEGPASFPTWLRAVVRRLCLDWRRHCDGRFRLPRSVARLPELDREAASHESAAALQRALGALDSRARLLVQLRYEQELPLAAVARLTGLDGAGQAERRLRQALAALRAELAARGFTGWSVEER